LIQNRQLAHRRNNAAPQALNERLAGTLNRKLDDFHGDGQASQYRDDAPQDEINTVTGLDPPAERANLAVGNARPARYCAGPNFGRPREIS